MPTLNPSEFGILMDEITIAQSGLTLSQTVEITLIVGCSGVLAILAFGMVLVWIFSRRDNG